MIDLEIDFSFKVKKEDVQFRCDLSLDRVLMIFSV